ncbi:hypothetical protein C8F04DRAFT_1189708 [Mycena alexandri]|uniref:Uncharacterized protein n=1 Tax=Mycena alexandri TaxID=1745969 RepID=A0AAD6SHI6_9AGAR|nr:hypothetical protein C8F04DRAFT_1189982 [Mycena alexandri]KAJ7027272.1 hypothetical protein C8F04DRAFT_1189708 [Mycena alexandri]
MSGHNTISDSYELLNTPMTAFDPPYLLVGPQSPKNSKTGMVNLRVLRPRAALHWPNSARSMLIGSSPTSGVNCGARNEDLLRDKARERMARRRLKAREDPELAAAAAAQKRVHDGSYRQKFKDRMRRDDEYYRQHGVHHPSRQTREYEQELQIVEDERWLKAMPAHRRQGTSGGY